MGIVVLFSFNKKEALVKYAVTLPELLFLFLFLFILLILQEFSKVHLYLSFPSIFWEWI